MIALCALQHRPGIIYLGCDEISRKYQARCCLIGDTVLLLPQEHIARIFSADAREELSLRREEGKSYGSFRAGAQQGGARTAPAEIDDAFEREERHAAQDGFPLFHNNIFIFERELRVLRHDEKRIQQAAHLIPSFPDRRRSRPQHRGAS